MYNTDKMCLAWLAYKTHYSRKSTYFTVIVEEVSDNETLKCVSVCVHACFRVFMTHKWNIPDRYGIFDDQGGMWCVSSNNCV